MTEQGADRQSARPGRSGDLRPAEYRDDNWDAGSWGWKNGRNDEDVTAPVAMPNLEPAPVTSATLFSKDMFTGLPLECSGQDNSIAKIRCHQLLVSLNCVFDASLVPETCLEPLSLPVCCLDSIRQAKADPPLVLCARSQAWLRYWRSLAWWQGRMSFAPVGEIS